MLFAVIPVSTKPAFRREDILWCETRTEAIKDAEQQTAETGRPHAVLEVIFTTEECDPIPLHEINGVTPGVDFPATLY